MNGFTYTELDIDKLYETLTMIRDVFMEFEAPDYSEEGIEEFLCFLEPDEIMEKLENKELRIWVCEYDDKISGAIAASEDHINLLFVAAEHHRKGIARRLLEIMKENYNPVKITVNSSPYALEAYRRLGFKETDTEQEIKGIRYTPMVWYSKGIIMKVTKNDIRKAIAETGLSGELVCIHSSLSSFGEVEGGADTVIDAFLEEGCTILAPSFSYFYSLPRVEIIEQNDNDYDDEPFESNGKIYNTGINEIAPDMGAIPRTMLLRAGRSRGYHPTNSFVAIGPEAEKLVSCQTPEEVYAPFQKLMDLNGKIVMIGVGLTKMTAIHYAEKLSGRNLFINWALDKNGNTIRIREGSCSDGFDKLDSAVEKLEKQTTVGNSLWRIFPIKETVEACAEAIKKDPSITYCGKPNCGRCNDMQKGGPVL